MSTRSPARRTRRRPPRAEICRALISVYDKTGLEDLAKGLHAAGVELVSTGSTAKRISAVGVDGCGAPVAAISLIGLARAFGRMVQASPASAEGRVAQAMAAHPEFVGGTDRDVTRFMTALPGAIAKDGAEAVHALAGAVGQWNRPERARAVLVGIAARAAPSEVVGPDWRPVALMSLLRAVVVDLLQMTGLSREQARDTLTDTWGRPFAEHVVDVPPTGSDDDASPVWG